MCLHVFVEGDWFRSRMHNCNAGGKARSSNQTCSFVSCSFRFVNLITNALDSLILLRRTRWRLTLLITVWYEPTTSKSTCQQLMAYRFRLCLVNKHQLRTNFSFQMSLLLTKVWIYIILLLFDLCVLQLAAKGRMSLTVRVSAVTPNSICPAPVRFLIYCEKKKAIFFSMLFGLFMLNHIYNANRAQHLFADWPRHANVKQPQQRAAAVAGQWLKLTK